MRNRVYFQNTISVLKVQKNSFDGSCKRSIQFGPRKKETHVTNKFETHPWSFRRVLGTFPGWEGRDALPTSASAPGVGQRPAWMRSEAPGPGSARQVGQRRPGQRPGPEGGRPAGAYRQRPPGRGSSLLWTQQKKRLAFVTSLTDKSIHFERHMTAPEIWLVLRVGFDLRVYFPGGENLFKLAIWQ